jgi:hypothetical protein
MVIPKMVYIATVFDPPHETQREIQKQIRNFVFRHTIRSIKMKTMMQPKKEGGVGLQDLATKIRALRLAYIGDVVREPHKYPLEEYYVGLRLTKHMRPNNMMPHNSQTPPLFYKCCLNAIKENGNLIGEKTNKIYKTLIRKQAPPLQERIWRGRKYGITNFSATFRNLHKYQTSQKAGEVAFRLI